MRKNPIKYSDSLGLCEGLIATNSDNDFIKIWVRDHLVEVNNWLGGLIVENGESGLVGQFLLLQQSLLRISPSYYIGVENFGQTMDLILKLFGSINSMEVQKEGARFLTLLSSYKESFVSPKCVGYFQHALAAIFKGFLVGLGNTMTWKSNVLINLLINNKCVLESGVGIETIHGWLAFGLQACQSEILSDSDKETVYGVLCNAKKVQDLRVI